MKNLFLISLIFFASIISGISQVPSAFNYQAVVRSSSGEVVANIDVSFRISILQNSDTGPAVYVETHSAKTNNFGLVNLQIGKGTVLSGVFTPGGWGSSTHFIKVEIDPAGGNAFTHLATSMLLSVPYAFHAQTVENDLVDDADADPNNEIQLLQLNGTQLSLSNGGGTVAIPSSADNWGTQTVTSDATILGEGTTANPLSVDNSTITPAWENIQNMPGGFADNSDDVEDGDANPNNEIQTLSISGNDLTISDGNTIVLPNNSSIWKKEGTDIYFTGGKVGIGINNPAEDLVVHTGDAPISSIAVQTNASGNKTHDGMQMFINSFNEGYLINYENEKLNFGINNQINMTIIPDGKVGIGTTQPTHNLTIDGKDGSTAQLCLQNNTTGGNINDGLLLGINLTNNASYLWNYENAPMGFGTNNTQQMLISANGNVAIGEYLIPTANLHVKGNDGVLFEGTYGSGTIPIEGRGTRMMWYSAKAAFRCGYADNTEWDELMVGAYSTAMGNSTIASGWGSTAIGSYAEASETNSTSIGSFTKATGLTSTAFGYNTIASGDNSTTMGLKTEASGKNSTTMGEETIASGVSSTAMGIYSEASGLYSAAIGYSPNASGFGSIAIGVNTTANGYGSVALGTRNIGGGTPNSWVGNDPLLEIGNGQISPSNAFTVLKNGNIGIGTGITLANNVRLTVEGKENDYALIKINQTGTKEYAGLSVQRSDAEKWFIGMDRTTDNLQFRNSGSTNFMTIKEDGNVGIGTTNPQGKLDINGSIYQRGGTLHADYVFEDDYQLESIAEHADFMWKNKHLPAIPKATVDEKGVEIVEVGSHRKGIVEELEKAHIYISQLEKTLQQQADVINNQESRLKQLESVVKAIASK